MCSILCSHIPPYKIRLAIKNVKRVEGVALDASVAAQACGCQNATHTHARAHTQQHTL